MGEMAEWTNEDIVNWIQSMRLDPKSENNLLSVIKFSQCKGQNIFSLTSAKDVADAFNCSKRLSEKIFSEIESFEVRQIKNIEAVDEEEEEMEKVNEIKGMFRINILSQ